MTMAKEDRDAPLQAAIEAAGGVTKFAAELGVAKPAL
jgi:hypothetical protein